MKVNIRDQGFRVALAEALYVLRARRKVTMVEMAELARVTFAAYRSWETTRNLPAVENLLVLAKAHGIPLSDLIRMVEMRQRGTAAGLPPTDRIRRPTTRRASRAAAQTGQ